MPNDRPVSAAECEARHGAIHDKLDAVERSVECCRKKLVDGGRWMSEHDGRINTLWKQQHETNKEYGVRLTSMEKKVFWFAGFAAAIGAAVPTVIAFILGG